MTSTPTADIVPAPKQKAKKELLSAPRSTWMWALAFLLSLSLIGLQFFPAILFVVVILVNRLVKDRADFLIMITIMATSPGFIHGTLMPFAMVDPLLALAAIGLLFYRKNLMVKKLVLITFAYILFLFIMSAFSDEVLSIQVLTIRKYASIILFILPLWVFANRNFDIRELYRKILVYFLIICAFYVLDGFVFSGWVLLPGTLSEHEMLSALWYLDWSPLSTYFPRKYPSAMYIVILAAYPLSRYFKLKWWQWTIVCVAFAATRTMSVVAAFILTYVIFQGAFLRFMKIAVITVIGMTALYFIDMATGDFMRIHSTVEQFAALGDSSSDKDLQDFGTGRMAQIIPKYEALVDQNCLWQGFGFIHPEKTTLPRYQIYNEYYSDVTKAYENAAYVEVTQFNTVLHTGIIGLVVQTVFYLAIYFLIRRGKEAQFYLSAILMASVMGVGGFGGLTQDDSLMYVALALGACLLESRPRRSRFSDVPLGDTVRDSAQQ